MLLKLLKTTQSYSVTTVYYGLQGVLILLSIGTATTTAADIQNCSGQYYQHHSPNIIDKAFAINSFALCFEGFAVTYSGISHTPLWSAEHLTRERLEQAYQLERENSYHEESKLPTSVAATLADYAHPSFDRGHLAPNADMANIHQQYNSFSLANLVPQNPTHNRFLWKSVESNTRYLTLKYGEAYVVTGVAFMGDKLRQINNTVLVPSHLYKAIYIPKINQAGVYFAPNDDSGRIQVLSLDELASNIGIDVMPELDIATKQHAYTLPQLQYTTNNPHKDLNLEPVKKFLHQLGQQLTRLRF